MTHNGWQWVCRECNSIVSGRYSTHHHVHLDSDPVLAFGEATDTAVETHTTVYTRRDEDWVPFH